MTVRAVLIENGNLFAIAAKYLGDATQWVRIAELNDLRTSAARSASVQASAESALYG